jgi:hypothetical protein
VGPSAPAARSPSCGLPGPTLTDIAYLEHFGNALFLTDRDDVDPYRAAMERVMIAAKKPAETVSHLEKILRRKSARQRTSTPA